MLPTVRRPRYAQLAVLAFALSGLTATACGGGDSSGPSGSSNSVPVGPEGGTAEFASGAVTLVVPAGALSNTIELVVQATTAFPQASGVVPTAVYDFGPDGTQFSQPVSLTIEFAPSSIPSTVDESELRLYKVVGSAWELVAGSSVNELDNAVIGNILSFSKYGVRGLHVETVGVTPASQQVNVSSTAQFTAQPQGPGNVNLTRTVTWTSSNDAVATVDANGVVTGQSAGTATITATADGVQGSATVTVNDPVFTVDVTPATPAINVGETVQLTATPRGIKGNAITGKTPTWATLNEPIASVSQSGLVTGNNQGSADITATIDDVVGVATVAVSISLQSYAGTWIGSWTNTTFGSSGPASLVITVNEQAGTMQFTLDLGGNVFDGGDPPASVFSGTATNGAFSVSGNSATFGNVTLTGNGAAFTGQGLNVPGGVVSRVTFTGTVSTTQITWNYQVFNPNNVQFAQGTMVVNKQ